MSRPWELCKPLCGSFTNRHINQHPIPYPMALDEFDVDATELLETYGLFSDPVELDSCSSTFRLLNEVHYHRCVALTGNSCFRARLIALSGEAGTGKSCLLHHFTHNACLSSVSLWGISLRPPHSQGSLSTYHRGRVL